MPPARDEFVRNWRVPAQSCHNDCLCIPNDHPLNGFRVQCASDSGAESRCCATVNLTTRESEAANPSPSPSSIYTYDRIPLGDGEGLLV